MAKLKNSFLKKNNNKLPLVNQVASSSDNTAKTAIPNNHSARLLSSLTSGPAARGLNFGSMHTKPGGSSSSPGSQWTNLLNSASGGASSILGGGLFLIGGLGFIGKLFNLFGGAKTPPVAPTQFQSPVSQHASLNITTPGTVSSISSGAHPVNSSSGGAYEQIGSPTANHATQSAQVIQIVKQALLTSSSLNDVISEL
jgi:hypothetical protein